MSNEIKNLSERLDRIEEVLSAAAAEDFSFEIDVDPEAADELTSVEAGINLLISDLSDEARKRKELAAQLEQARKNVESE
ncbi:hypothetical protein JXM67_14510 [candidate division WOR-3 bacterium]|nr:hypothetical protein [candidate division WOR-3 bacterium]